MSHDQSINSLAALSEIYPGTNICIFSHPMLVPLCSCLQKVISLVNLQYCLCWAISSRHAFQSTCSCSPQLRRYACSSRLASCPSLLWTPFSLLPSSSRDSFRRSSSSAFCIFHFCLVWWIFASCKCECSILYFVQIVRSVELHQPDTFHISLHFEGEDIWDTRCPR